MNVPPLLCRARHNAHTRVACRLAPLTLAFCLSERLGRPMMYLPPLRSGTARPLGDGRNSETENVLQGWENNPHVMAPDSTAARSARYTSSRSTLSRGFTFTSRETQKAAVLTQAVQSRLTQSADTFRPENQ